ncbi:MAG: hypothetical protein R3228_18640, partial [Halioglobus sp.]|nr:hypothetical protein [Halioglobus sp.]
SKLQTLPVLGRLASLFSGLRLVGNLDPDSQLFLAQQRSDHERLAHASARVVDHLDQILDRLGGGADSAGSQETAVDVVLPVGVTHVALAWLLTLGVEEFLSWSFHRVLARQPVEEESALALQSLAEGRVTRTRFLGDLCRDNDVDIDSINVVGLPQAYRRERLFGLPLVGFFFRVPRLLYLLGHLEALYDYQASEVASGAARVAGVEARLMSHYNQTVRQVRRELDKAVREQPDQFEDL